MLNAKLLGLCAAIGIVLSVGSPAKAEVIFDSLSIDHSVFIGAGTPDQCAFGGCNGNWSPFYSINPGDTLDFGMISFGSYALCNFVEDSPVSDLGNCGLTSGALGFFNGTSLGFCNEFTDLNCLSELRAEAIITTPVLLEYTNNTDTMEKIQVMWMGPLFAETPDPNTPATPIPAAFWLFASGLGLFGWGSRFRVLERG